MGNNPAMETDTPTRGVRPSLFGRSTRDVEPFWPGSDAAGHYVRVADRSIWTRVPGAAGLRLTGVSGHLWITQANVARDATVEPGEAFVARGGGKVVVQTIGGDAVFRVEDGV